MDDADHRAIIAALPDADRRFLTAKADLPGLLRLAVQGGAILILAAAVAVKVALWPLLMPPLGILIVFQFTLAHEAIHGTAFRTPFLNVAVSHAAGLPLLLPPSWFRYFHFAHHRHTGDPENDPELASPRPETFGAYALYLSGWFFWSGMVRALASAAFRGETGGYVPPKGRARVIREARIYLIVYGLLLAGSAAAGSTLLLRIWIVPALLGQPFLRAYLLAEHMGCPAVANMLENTRTTFTTALVRFLAWNMPYHAEHHSYPAVPFHRLPAFHRIVARHLRSTEQGYVRFHGKVMGDLAGRRGQGAADPL